jgi:hypothetical protein
MRYEGNCPLARVPAVGAPCITVAINFITALQERI